MPTFKVMLTQAVYFSVEVDVDADNEDDATDMALRDHEDDNPFNWGSDPSYGDLEVLEVTEEG